MQKLWYLAVAGALAAGIFFLAGFDDPRGGDWSLMAQNALIIGGYGDNFAYSGENVRPLMGTAVLRTDSALDAGELVATLRTTPESGPIRIGKDVYLEGEIRLVMRTFIEEAPFMDGGITEFLWIHGDTGQGPPVMPRQFAFLAGWGTLDIYLNGELLYKDLDGHFMYTEQARRGPEAGYAVAREDGTIYNPMLPDKTRFTDPTNGELHIVAHSTVTDPDNFPPHSLWIHLNFADVFVQAAPVATVSTVAP
jgi:hypothetical protein